MGDAKVALPLFGTEYENRKMLYYDYQLGLAGTAGILTTSYFRTNDLYDPWQSGVGHQPIGFDQVMLMWEQFAVFSSKISVTFVSDTDVPVRVGVFLNPDTTTPTVNDLVENGYVVSKVISGVQTGSARNIATVNLSCDNLKYFQYRTRDEYFANPNFIGNVTTSPTEMAYFGIFAFSMGTATTFQVYYDVTLSYDARFQEPRKLAHSLLAKFLQLQMTDEKERAPTDDEPVVVATPPVSIGDGATLRAAAPLPISKFPLTSNRAGGRIAR